jgi:hypothetical protein
MFQTDDVDEGGEWEWKDFRDMRELENGLFSSF